MNNYDTKPLDQPDETRTFSHGKVDVVRLAGHSIGRTNLEKGWRWSESVKPVVNTELCEVEHIGYCVAGRLGVVMRDGTELQIKEGEAYYVAPGHDAWVEGEGPFRGVEFESLAEYAKPS
jgi:hypothetical protein